MINETLADNHRKSFPSGLTVWFTGLSSSGKTTLSRAVAQELQAQWHHAEILDGDEIRHTLWPELGFSKHDRDENVRRIAYIAELLTRNRVIVLVSAISPYREARMGARRQIGRFVEVYVNAPLEVCESRDVKGLYKRARAGSLSGMTGIDDPYEAPDLPEVECRTDRESLAECSEKVVRFVQPWLAAPECKLSELLTSR
jgi:adenylyl-sulfate kinase